MSSIDPTSRVDALFDALDAAHESFLALPLGSLPTPELLAIMERYAFAMGRLDALRYELTSPFVHSGGRTIDGVGRRT
jgi:hypothetical protein